MAKYSVQFHFKNGTNYQYIADYEDNDEIIDLLVDYQSNRHKLILAGDGPVPFLFNPDNVLIIVATPAKELEESSECVDGEPCCKAGSCH